MSRERIAGVLREYRIKKGLKATTVGALVGKSGKTVSGWEYGNGQPDIDTLLKLCVIYGIDSFDVFRDENDKNVALHIEKPDASDECKNDDSVQDPQSYGLLF